MIPCLKTRHLRISLLVFSTLLQNLAFAIPHIVHTRQTTLLSGLQLPGCAFRCFITHLLDDGCDNEADFACHCAGEKLIQASSACIEQGCGKVQKNDAVAKVKAGCAKGLGGGQPQTDATSSSSSSSTTATSKTNNPEEAAVTTSSATRHPISSATTFQPSIQIPATAIASIPTKSATNTPSSISRTAVPTPTSTRAPKPPSEETGQLSAGAKAGIGVSVAALPIIAAAVLLWYIRRLKRRAHAAQQSDGIPPAPDSTSTARGRRPTNNAYPVGPASSSNPRGTQDDTTVSNIGYGMVMKKRGPVLSILLEREDEDRGSVREPVPGQREGLAPPLELDAEATAVWELPTSVTPRSGSVAR